MYYYFGFVAEIEEFDYYNYGIEFDYYKVIEDAIIGNHVTVSINDTIINKTIIIRTFVEIHIYLIIIIIVTNIIIIVIDILDFVSTEI